MRTPIPSPRNGRPPIALLSDFGYRDHYAGVMRGVLAGLAPGAVLIDITHGIPAQDVVAGALALRESVGFFPAGTVFLAVVDPGVGSDRRGVAIETAGGARLVGPDNGLLWPAAGAAGGVVRAVELAEPRLRLAQTSTTFHGRDIFAPAAAHLWNGLPIGDFGPSVTDLEQLDFGQAELVNGALLGSVIYVDGYGNLITNIGREQVLAAQASFPSHSLWVSIGDRTRVPIAGTYANVAKGTPIALFGSFNLLEIAIRDGDAAAYFEAGAGTPIRVAPRPSGTPN